MINSVSSSTPFALIKELQVKQNRPDVSQKIDASNLIERLDVTTKPDRLKEIFAKHRVIVLREPADETSLLCFCGNQPIHCCMMDHTYDANAREKHAEPPITLIILMNPSIVGEWPSREVTAYLKEKVPLQKNPGRGHASHTEFP